MILNLEYVNMLRKYVPNFIHNFVVNGETDIISVVDVGDKFVVLSYDNENYFSFMVGFIYKEDEESSCFKEDHMVFYDDDNGSSFIKAKKEFNNLVMEEMGY